MIINGPSLITAAPIKDMLTTKVKFKGVSHGLSEGGYDIRLAQDVSFQRSYNKLRGELHEQSIVHGKEGTEVTNHTCFALASAIEEFDMPRGAIGIVHDKSTWARHGLSVFNTVIEPNWKGFLTLELVYHGYGTLHLPAGVGIAQVVFHEVRHGAEYIGKYQNQANKPVKPIMEKPHERS